MDLDYSITGDRQPKSGIETGGGGGGGSGSNSSNNSNSNSNSAGDFGGSGRLWEGFSPLDLTPPLARTPCLTPPLARTPCQSTPRSSPSDRDHGGSPNKNNAAAMSHLTGVSDEMTAMLNVPMTPPISSDINSGGSGGASSNGTNSTGNGTGTSLTKSSASVSTRDLYNTVNTVNPLKNSEILSPSHSHSFNTSGSSLKNESHSGRSSGKNEKKDRIDFLKSIPLSRSLSDSDCHEERVEKKFLIVDDSLFNDCIADFAGNAYETIQKKNKFNNDKNTNLSLTWIIALLYGFFTLIYCLLIYMKHMANGIYRIKHINSSVDSKFAFWCHTALLVFAPVFTITSQYKKFIASSDKRLLIYRISTAVHLAYAPLLIEDIIGKFSFI
jgi:hypothetical protein